MKSVEIFGRLLREVVDFLKLPSNQTIECMGGMGGEEETVRSDDVIFHNIQCYRQASLILWLSSLLVERLAFFVVGDLGDLK